MIDAEALLRRMFDAALAAADPKLCLPPFLVPLATAPCAGRTVVIGAGKAAAAMAAATEAVWAEHAPGAPLAGLVVPRYGPGCPTARSEERRVGEAWVSTVESWWYPDHYKTKQIVKKTTNNKKN